MHLYNPEIIFINTNEMNSWDRLWICK